MILIARPLYGRKVQIWQTGGKNTIIEAPIAPFFYSLQDRSDATVRVTKRLLSTLKEAQLYKVECRDRKQVEDLRDEYSLEADRPYMHTLFENYNWKHPDAIFTHLAFDIETGSTGQFSSADKDPIKSISLYSKKTQITFTGSEQRILTEFKAEVLAENPDLIDTFNGGRFDWPYVITRSHKYGMLMGIDREGREPSIYKKIFQSGYKKGVDYTVYMSGRLSFDCYKEARFDTALVGKVKNKQLKTVGKYFFGKERVVEANRAKIDELSDEDLRKYNISDARLTWMLSDHYLRLLKFLALSLQVPLDFIINRSPSHIGNTIYGRKFAAAGIVSDGPNFDRFIGVLWEDYQHE